MGRIFDGLKAFFEKDEWKTELVEEHALRTAFAGEHGTWGCLARAREAQEQIIFYSYFPTEIPQDRRTVVGEFVNRANYGMLMGNFEIDYTDGEVRYKTAIDVEGAELTHILIRSLVYANVMTMNRYFKSLMAVAHENATVEQAIAAAEA